MAGTLEESAVFSKVVIVLGARRTGTTLVASVLSSDAGAPPFPGEAQLLTRLVESYSWAKAHFGIGAAPFFDDQPSLLRYFSELVRQFMAHCARQFPGRTTLVLKCPEMSLCADALFELFPRASYVLCTRDPRDQVTSEWRVLERRQGASDRAILKSRNFAALTKNFLRYHDRVLDAARTTGKQVTLLPYERLVRSPEKVVVVLEKELGLDLSAFDPGSDWRLADSYWAYGTSPSDTPHYGKPITCARIGAYTEVLTADESDLVMDLCASLFEKLQYFPGEEPT
ncbi:MAG: sulfotransferase [Lysobacteraceae bacterium]